jgi:hypothetical protein
MTLGPPASSRPFIVETQTFPARFTPRFGFQKMEHHKRRCSLPIRRFEAIDAGLFDQHHILRAWPRVEGILRRFFLRIIRLFVRDIAMHVFVRFDLPIVRLPVPHLTAIRGLHRGVYDLIGQAFVATIGRPPRPARPFVLAATSNRK